MSRTYYFMNDMPPSLVSIRFWRIAPTQSTMLISLLRVTWKGAVSAAYRNYQAYKTPERGNNGTHDEVFHKRVVQESLTKRFGGGRHISCRSST